MHAECTAAGSATFTGAPQVQLLTGQPTLRCTCGAPVQHVTHARHGNAQVWEECAVPVSPMLFRKAVRSGSRNMDARIAPRTSIVCIGASVPVYASFAASLQGQLVFLRTGSATPVRRGCCMSAATPATATVCQAAPNKLHNTPPLPTARRGPSGRTVRAQELLATIFASAAPAAIMSALSYALLQSPRQVPVRTAPRGHTGTHFRTSTPVPLVQGTTAPHATKHLRGAAAHPENISSLNHLIPNP